MSNNNTYINNYNRLKEIGKELDENKSYITQLRDEVDKLIVQEELIINSKIYNNICDDVIASPSNYFNLYQLEDLELNIDMISIENIIEAEFLGNINDTLESKSDFSPTTKNKSNQLILKNEVGKFYNPRLFNHNGILKKLKVSLIEKARELRSNANINSNNDLNKKVRFSSINQLINYSIKFEGQVKNTLEGYISQESYLILSKQNMLPPCILLYASYRHSQVQFEKPCQIQFVKLFKSVLLLESEKKSTNREDSNENEANINLQIDYIDLQGSKCKVNYVLNSNDAESWKDLISFAYSQAEVRKLNIFN